MNRFFTCAFIALFASGCALSVDEIDIPYEGKANITVVSGAENVAVTVVGDDKRSVYKDRVSAKKNGYGMEMASIVSKNDVVKTFSDAVKFELENLGFKIGAGGKKITVELVRFYNDFKMGFFAGDAVADGLVNIVVRDTKGDNLFSRSYEGGSIEKNIQLALGHNARTALIGAMSDIVSKIAQDKDLHAALLK
jgi:uncharacterized lipoprotein YajG